MPGPRLRWRRPGSRTTVRSAWMSGRRASPRSGASAMQESGDGSGRPGQGGQSGQESFGSVPSPSGGSDSFGTVPSHGDETFGTTSHPPAPPAAPPTGTGGSRNVGLLVGGVVAVLVVIAAIIGFD